MNDLTAMCSRLSELATEEAIAVPVFQV